MRRSRAVVIGFVALMIIAGLPAPVPAAPLLGPLRIASAADLVAAGATGSGTADDPWVLAGLDVSDPNGTALSIVGIPGHFVLRDLHLAGRVLLTVSDVDSLVVDHLEGNATEEGVVIQNVTRVDLRNWHVRSAGGGLAIADVEHLDTRFVNLSAQDGMFLTGVSGNVTLGALHVEHSGVTASDFRGVIQNVNVHECSGTGFTLLGGSPMLIGNAAECRRAGFRITDVRNLVLEGNAAAHGEDGFVVLDSTVTSTGDVARGAATGFRLVDSTATLLRTIVEDARVGIHVEGGSASITQARVTGAAEAGLRGVGTTLSESGNVLENVGLGVDFQTVDLVGPGGGGATIVKQAATGGRLAGTRSLGTPWRGLDVRSCDLGLDVRAGVDVRITELNLLDCRIGGDMRAGGHVEIEDGVWRLVEGFTVESGGILRTEGITATVTDGPFVRANDSRVEDDASVIGSATVDSQGIAFDLRGSFADLKDTKMFRPWMGIRLDGLPAAIEDELPNASRFQNIRIERAGHHGAHLLNGAVAEFDDGLITRSNLRNPVGMGHGILVEGQSAFVLTGGIIVEFSDGDGVHWTGLGAVPRSTLFPPGPDGSPAAFPRIDHAQIHGSKQTGLFVRDVPKDVEFRIHQLETRKNTNDGARFTDVDATITESAFGQILPGVEPGTLCIGTCFREYGNGRDGLFAIWNGAAGAEHLEIDRSTFTGNGDNGISLWKHGEGTRITGSELDDNGKVCNVSCPSQGGGDILTGHGVFVAEPSGKGPLLRGNDFLGSRDCQIRSNGNVRIVKNNVTADGLGGCGIHVRDAAAAEIHENRVTGEGDGGHSIGIYVARSSATVIGNFLNSTAMAHIMVDGTGSETVTVADNRIFGVHTATLVVFCGVDCVDWHSGNAQISWANAKGVIERNLLDSGNSTICSFCFGPSVGPNVGIYRAPAGAVPEIRGNQIFTYTTGILLYDDTGFSFGSTGTSVGRSYEGVNRIYDNVFTARATFAGQSPAAASPTAIGDRHGHYDPNERTHDEPTLGANVRNNAYTTGIHVACHRFFDDEGVSHIDSGHACDESGKLGVASHDFGPGTTATPPAGPRTPPAYTPPPEPSTRTRGRFGTTERPPGPPPCGGFHLPQIVEFHADREPNAGRLFRINGTIPWVEVIPWRGRMCDDLADIKIKVTANGEVLKEITAAAIPNHELDITHTFTEDALYTIRVEVSIDSESASAGGKQKRAASDEAWAGSGPRILSVETEFGTAFLKGVPIPGGVEMTATMRWPPEARGQPALLVWRAGATEWKTRTIAGPREVSTSVQPGVDFSILGGGDTILVQVQALMVTPDKERLESNVVDTRLKLIAFPAALALIFLPAETEVQVISPPTGGRTLAYKWEWQVHKFGKVEERVRLPVIGGKYELEFGLGAKMTANSAGGGSFGIQGGYGLDVEPENKRLEFAGSLKVDGNALVQMDDIALTGGSFVVKPELDLMLYVFPSDLVPPFKIATRAPLLGRYLTELDEVVRVGVGVGLEAEVTIQFEWADGFRCGGLRDGWKCSGEVVLKPRINAKAVGEVEDIGGLTVYAKLSPFWSVNTEKGVPGDLLGPGKYGAEAEVGLEAEFMEWKRAWKIIGTIEYQSPGVGGSLETDSDWRIPERSWTDGGTYRGTDAEIVANLTSGAHPAVAFNGDTALAVWGLDDLAVAHPRGGEIAAAFRDATGAWRNLGVLSTDDVDLLDARPSVAPLAGGKFLVAWSRNTNGTLSTSAILSPGVTTTHEVMALVVDPALATPATPTRLTNDAVFDSGGVAVSGPDGAGAVVWRKHLTSPIVAEAGDVVETWAAKVGAGGAIAAPVKAIDDADSQAWRAAWGNGRLWFAEVTERNVTLRSTDLANPIGAPIALGATGGAPPVLAIRADHPSGGLTNNRYVAWVRANATNASRADLMESVIGPSGTVTTRPVANDVVPAQLAYAGGDRTLARTLVWTQRQGDRDEVWRAVFEINKWTATRFLTDDDDIRLLAAKAGRDLTAIVKETQLVNVTRTVDYAGPNLDDPEETVTFSRTIDAVEPGAASLRYLAAASPRVVAPLQPLDATLVTTEANLTHAVVRATIENVGTNVSAPRPASLVLGPWQGAEQVRVPVTLPAIPAGTTGFLETTIPLPAGEGWWTVQLEAPALRSAAGVLRLAPEWSLPQADATRTGDTVSFRLVNSGPRAGATIVRAHELFPSGELGGSLGEATLSVPAGGSLAGSVAVPAGTGHVVLLANPPRGDQPIDQTDFGDTVALVEYGPGLFSLAAEITVPPGVTPFRLDLGRFAGAHFAASATLDGAPLPFTVERGVVTGSVALAAGDHVVKVLARDLLGAERELTLVIHARAAGGDGTGGGGGSSGTGGNGTSNGTAPETPELPLPWFRRLGQLFGIPAPSAALVAVVLAALAVAARRRIERP